MSLKKFMHPRNKYITEPNFKSLAMIDSDFRKIATTQLNGKVCINFKDKTSLITLTKTLLKHDFNLNVNIPDSKLVPALPLRLNYILWVEDILNFGKFTTENEIHGIDIGIGASCIYPLLISKQYKWKMTGTEIDQISLKFAQENIKQNNLESLINVTLITADSILKEVVKEGEKFTFVMCNPPFFKTDDMTRIKKNPPRNASTGCDRELLVEGGEQKFISRLIEDSIELKNQIKIYTTMFGRKSTLSFVKKELATKNITNFTWTEFCQGYTKRWGIAWTFLPLDVIKLKEAPVIRTKTEVSKKNKDSAFVITFPKTEELQTVDNVNDTFVKCVKELNVLLKSLNLEEENDQCFAYQIIAFEDRWSHARRKRRMIIRDEIALKKQCKPEDNDHLPSSSIDEHVSKPLISEYKKQNNETKNTEVEERLPYLKCNVLIHEIDNDDVTDQAQTIEQLQVCFIFEDGSGGKQALETMRQYFINKLNVRQYVTRSKPKKKNKKKKKDNNKVESNSIIKI